MNRIGKAQLITYKHSTGIQAQGWALNPWIPNLVLHMGAAGSPLPPPGSTVDRGMLRIDTGTGDVYQLVAGDPPPKLGPTGGPTQPGAGISGALKRPLTLVVVAVAAWLAWKTIRKR